jgi:hypothetical protein
VHTFDSRDGGDAQRLGVCDGWIRLLNDADVETLKHPENPNPKP